MFTCWQTLMHVICIPNYNTDMYTAYRVALIVTVIELGSKSAQTHLKLRIFSSIV